MKKYKVLRDNFGFKGRYWEEGKIVDLEDDDEPPHHFELVENIKPPLVDTRPDPLKPIPVEPGKPIKPKGGFAAAHQFDLPKETETAGKALKHKKK